MFASLLLAAISLRAFAADTPRPFSLDKQLDLIKPNIEYRGNDALQVLECLIYCLENPFDPYKDSISIINTNEPSGPGILFDRSLPIVTNQPYLELYLRNSTARNVLDYITKSLNLHYTVTATHIFVYTDDGVPLNKKRKSVEQSVPGYPPQGVGSPEP